MGPALTCAQQEPELQQFFDYLLLMNIFTIIVAHSWPMNQQELDFTGSFVAKRD